jgi:phosphatidylcholine synthase
VVKLGKRRNRPRRVRVQSAFQKCLAWGVHFYTAMGLVAAAGIAIMIVEGTPAAFHRAFLLMLIATLIDATDGTLARRVRVKEVLPGFDGRRLDDIVDFLNYTFLPLLLIWRADIIPADLSWLILVPLLASAYGFSQVSAKTDDGFFLGFPSYWNLVAFYLYVLRPEPWLVIGMLIGFALLTFVPFRYLYPTQRGRLNRWTNMLGAAWTVLFAWILLNPTRHEFGGEHTRALTVISLSFPMYYLVASWLVSLRIWRVRRVQMKNEIMQALP